MKSNHKIEAYFPRYTKKSVTFTIDDGNVAMDTKFLSIVKPAGIIGTFNLCAPTRQTPEAYREMYQGYEIANHCKHHPLAFKDEMEYIPTDEPFDPLTSREHSPEDPVVYKTDIEGIYKIHIFGSKTQRPSGWHYITDTENYVRFSRECRDELEEVFGKGSIKSFVWPFGDQKNESLHAALAADGYNSIRKTGVLDDSTGFSFPADRMAWSYNANNTNLLETMEKYENYPDDGELKFFSFGVHSYDFERDNNWDVLEKFAEKYGNRPDDYYYATVSDLLEYEDAVKALKVTDTEIINDSNKEIFLTVDGKKISVAARSSCNI